MVSKLFRSFSLAKKEAYLAVFIALAVVANIVLDIDLTPSVKLTFSYVVCFFAAYLMGGVPAFAVAFLGDLIGFFIKPSGVYWLFGVTMGVYALLVGVILHLLPVRGRGAPYIKAAVALLAGYIAVTLCLNSVVNYYYVKLLVYHGDYDKPFFVYLGGRIAMQSAVYAVNVGVCFALLPLIVHLPYFRTVKNSRNPRKS